MSAEQFTPTLQLECPDHFVACGTKYLDYLVREFVEHYHASGRIRDWTTGRRLGWITIDQSCRSNTMHESTWRTTQALLPQGYKKPKYSCWKRAFECL